MPVSHEIRWFGNGAFEDGVEEWFSGDVPLDWRSCKSRTDSYILVPDVPDVGIKIRNEKFEVKGLEKSRSRHQFGARAEGWAETWVKWSHRSDPIRAWTEVLNASLLEQTAVAKTRIQRKFGFDRGEMIGLPFKMRPDEGGLSEMTVLTVDGHEYWTIAFETFESGGTFTRADELRATLLAWVRHEIVDRECPLPLDANRSMSYPAWLLSR